MGTCFHIEQRTVAFGLRQCRPTLTENSEKKNRNKLATIRNHR